MNQTPFHTPTHKYGGRELIRENRERTNETDRMSGSRAHSPTFLTADPLHSPTAPSDPTRPDPHPPMSAAAAVGFMDWMGVPFSLMPMPYAMSCAGSGSVCETETGRYETA